MLWDHESDGKVAAAPREVRHGDICIFDYVFFESEKLCFDPNTRKTSVFLLRRQLLASSKSRVANMHQHLCLITQPAQIAAAAAAAAAEQQQRASHHVRVSI